MKKFILLFLISVAMTGTVFSEKRAVPTQVHNGGQQSQNIEDDRCPINLPIAVYYDSDTNILEVWCDDDNIQAEVYVYSESGAVEAFSPYMNVTLQLTSSTSHYILVKGDGWEGECDL
ncbi:MAG: hypothetical protein K2M16_08195 [Muribaculaceae bacterium]|nr:hypothetical protein [Muribaculaceae bacterium]